MHSYTTLAVLALAVSTASPAFSAPVPESEHQARVDINERGINIGDALKTLGIGAGLGALPAVIDHFINVNSTRRALSDDEKRDPSPRSLLGSLLKKLETNKGLGTVVGNGALGGVASGVAATAVGGLLENDKREPFKLGGIGKTLFGLATSLAAATGVEDLFGSDDTNNTRREPSPFSLGDDSLRRGAVERRDDVSDLINALQLLGRQLDELD